MFPQSSLYTFSYLLWFRKRNPSYLSEKETVKVEAKMETQVRVRGRVKSIKRPEGFAFLTPENGGLDFFMHRSGLQTTTKSFAELNEGDPVEFTPIEGPKGPRAIEVRVTE